MATSEPVRIAVMPGTFGGGGLERAVLTFLRGIDRTRFAPEIICYTPEGGLRDAFEALGMPIHVRRLRRWNLPWMVGAVASLLGARDIRLIHSHGYHCDVVARLAARRAGIACINTIHTNSSWKRGPKGPIQHFRRWFDGVTARLTAPACIALTESIRTFHRETLGYPDAPWRVIPNPLDLSRLRAPEAEVAAVRQELGLGPHDLFVLAVGNLLPIKGHRDLVDAVAQTPPEQRVFLGIAGEGPERTPLEERIRNSGAGTRMRLLGYREDVGRLLAASDIYAMPSYSEGQSVAILEAMFLAKPMILTTQGGHADFLRPDEHAILVPPGQPPELAEAIQRLGESEPLRSRMGHAAQALLERMGVLNAIEDQQDFYDALLREKKDHFLSTEAQ